MSNKVPGKRATEKMSSDLSRLLEGQDFESEEDLKTYMDSLVGGKLPEPPPKTALEFAQDIIYDAWETESRKERIEFAKEALSVSPECADAYNILAEEAETLGEAKELYEKGMEAGRRALGEKIFKEDGGHFWGYTPTRPYMRSCAGLMECLWDLEERNEAINQAREMLRLNTGDNQGIRYLLIAYLAELGRYDELDKFMNKGRYKNDFIAEWHYTRALLVFVKEGNSRKANKALKTALESNKYVPEYLTGKKPIPRFLPENIAVGGEDEGFCYADRNIKAWKKVPGAIEWLKDRTGIKIVPKADLNGPFPREYIGDDILDNEDDDEFIDFEGWETYSDLMYSQDFPGLVEYCEECLSRSPDDLYDQYRLGDAYVLNKEYDKAICFMTPYYRQVPDDPNFKNVILDALFALGKTEDDFDWIKRPVVLRISDAVVLDECYKFMKPKRKPRDVAQLHIELMYQGYLAFTEKDLLKALVHDSRFVVDDVDEVYFAKVQVVRKGKLNRTLKRLKK